jgi:HSP20 family protein
MQQTEAYMFRGEYPFRRSRLLGEEVFPLQRNFQRAFDYLLQDLLEPVGTTAVSAFMPQIDIDEDERQLKIMAELPGLKESDVEIVYEPGNLILRGEKREEEKREYAKGRGRYEERRYGAFERRIPVRCQIEEGQIQANFDRGVLTISLPKSAEARAQARKISIKTGVSEAQLEQGLRGREQPSAGAAAH